MGFDSTSAEKDLSLSDLPSTGAIKGNMRFGLCKHLAEAWLVFKLGAGDHGFALDTNSNGCKGDLEVQNTYHGVSFVPSN